MNLLNQRKFFLFGLFLFVVTSIHAQIDSSKVAITRFEKVSTDARINNIFIDERNVIWLAGSKGLIETIGDGGKYNVYFPDTEMRDVTADKRNNIWVASRNALYNQASKASFSLPVQATISEIAYLAGSVWVGTDNGLFEFNTTTSKFKSYDNKNSKLLSNKINFVHADKNNILWIGTDNGYIRKEEDSWELQDKKQKMLA